MDLYGFVHDFQWQDRYLLLFLDHWLALSVETDETAAHCQK
jgi:hypothetical protein